MACREFCDIAKYSLKKIAAGFVFSKPLVCFYKPFIKLMGKDAPHGYLSEFCLNEGFLPVPVHYYYPIPDIEDLVNRSLWTVKSELEGINFNVESQRLLLMRLGEFFGNECDWPSSRGNNPLEFYVNNGSFSYGCAASTHGIIRKYKPSTVIEIGSGMSSLVIQKALSMNGKGRHIIVDPYPNDAIKREKKESELIESRVELLNVSSFDQLKKDDVLFIDSGHTVRIGGDVNFLCLNVLPRLAEGVIVHIHDICLPYEYPQAYALRKSGRFFWTEQYLLQSFLCFNNEFEILLAMYYLQTDHSRVFRSSFLHYNPNIHEGVSSSFWIRRKRSATDSQRGEKANI